MEDSRGALCRIGRVAGTDQCVRGGRARPGGARSKGGERARSPDRLLVRAGAGDWQGRGEAGPLLAWLPAGLVAARFEGVVLGARHGKAPLLGITGETDRGGGRGVSGGGRRGAGAGGGAQNPRA